MKDVDDARVILGQATKIEGRTAKKHSHACQKESLVFARFETQLKRCSELKVTIFEILINISGVVV